MLLCLSVRHKPVLYRNNWSNLAGFWHGGFFTYPTLFLKEIRVPPKISILPSGTLLQTLKILPRQVDHIVNNSTKLVDGRACWRLYDSRQVMAVYCSSVSLTLTPLPDLLWIWWKQNRLRVKQVIRSYSLWQQSPLADLWRYAVCRGPSSVMQRYYLTDNSDGHFWHVVSPKADQFSKVYCHDVGSWTQICCISFRSDFGGKIQDNLATATVRKKYQIIYTEV